MSGLTNLEAIANRIRQTLSARDAAREGVIPVAVRQFASVGMLSVLSIARSLPRQPAYSNRLALS